MPLDDPYESLSVESDKSLLRDVQNSAAMENFLNEHPIGQYLKNRAEQDALQAARDISELPYEKAVEEFPALYAEMRFPRRLKQWVDDILNQGHLAKQILMDRDKEEQ